jgi:Cytochrome P450
MSAPLFISCSPYPSDRERVADVTTFLLAGHDTTGYQMSWIVIEISRHPSVLLKIRSELDLLITNNAPFTAQLLSQMKYLTMVIREGMRLWPVLPIGSNRVASRDIQYKEFVIPRGSTLGERGENPALSYSIMSCPVLSYHPTHIPQGSMHRTHCFACHNTLPTGQGRARSLRTSRRRILFSLISHVITTTRPSFLCICQR